MNLPELLAPAGNLEKLKAAVRYGADAVYCGGRSFGLRAKAGNLTPEELSEGIEFAHRRGVRVYVTVNVIPHNSELEGIQAWLGQLEKLGVDGIIVSDPGVVALARSCAPELELHLSTQANTTNWRAAEFWHKEGISRIILARELSLDELREINRRVDVELEVFVHGAMCISYSGRCLLSNYLAGRDANRGQCAQPCRWHYYLVEEERPGEYLPVIEDGSGTYIFNSRDLCLLDHLPRLVNAGADGLKIEGRMKSIHYVATVTRVYREALDRLAADPEGYETDPAWLEELKKISHRDYTTGFLFGPPGPEGQRYSTSKYIRTHDFLGIVRSYDPESRDVTVEVRNKIYEGDEVEIFGPDSGPFPVTIKNLTDVESGQAVDAAPHPHQLVRFGCRYDTEAHALVRRRGRLSNED